MKIAIIFESFKEKEYQNGSSTKNKILYDELNTFSSVDKYIQKVEKRSKMNFFLGGNDKVDDILINKINSKNYDYVIISAMCNSSYLYSYAREINTKCYFYLADSAFHMRSQYLSFKYKLATFLLSIKENKLLKNNTCIYLGKDEIKYIPLKLRKNAIIFPFYQDKNINSFLNSGHLLLVGDYSFRPNYEMLIKINEISKRLIYPVYVYGSNIPEIEYNKNIVIKGYAPTLDEVYRGARALLYPVNYGTGIKNKVIEALSYSIPVIGYKEAFTNLEDISDSVVIINSINELVNAANESDFSQKSSFASNYISTNMSLSVVVKKIESLLT